MSFDQCRRSRGGWTAGAMRRAEGQRHVTPKITAALLAAAAAGIANGAAAQTGPATTTWNGGAGNWSSALNWNNGLPGSGTAVLIDGGNSSTSAVTFDLSSVAAQSLTIDAGDSLNLSPTAGTLSLTGTSCLINGSLDLSLGASRNPALVFTGPNAVTLGGAGQVTLGRSLASGTNQLTIGPGLLIRGGRVPDSLSGLPAWVGTIVDGGGGIAYQGTVSADVDGAFIMLAGANGVAARHVNYGTWEARNGGTLVLGGNDNDSWQNLGVLRVDNATLYLDGNFSTADLGTLVRSGSSTVNVGGYVWNNNQVLDLNASRGSWNVLEGAIFGGTVRTSAGSQLLVGSSDGDYANLVGVTLDTGADGAQVLGDAWVQQGLTLANGARLTVHGSDWGYGVHFYGGTQSIGGSGEVFFASDGSTLEAVDETDSVTIGPGILVHGASFDIEGMGAWINRGTVAADVPGSTVRFRNTSQTNFGTWRVGNGATLVLDAEAWHNQGTIAVDDGGTLVLGGTFTPSDLGNIVRTGATTTALSGIFDLTGTSFTLDAAAGGTWVAGDFGGGYIQGGTFSTAGAGQLVVPDGTGINFIDTTLNTGANGIQFPANSQYGVTSAIKGTVTLANGTVLDLTGGGTAAAAVPSVLFFSHTSDEVNSAAIVGTGTVAVSTVYNELSGVATIGSGVLLRTGALIDSHYGTSSAGFLNQGSIRADLPGLTALTISAGMTNTGSIRTPAGVALDLTAAPLPFVQAAGELQVGGQLLVGSAGLTITGGAVSAPSTLNAGLIQQTGGTASLGPVSGAGSLSVATGTMTVASFAQNAVTVGNGGTVQVLQAPTPVTNSVGTLTLNGSGTLDLANHSLLVNSSDSIRTSIAQAAGTSRPGGVHSWDGTGGLTSSVVKADANSDNAKALALGYFDSRENATTGLNLAAGKTLVKYTVYGDATGDGVDDTADFTVWRNNFFTGTRWSQGDFNYDGAVDTADFTIWRNNFFKSANGGAAGAAAAAAAAKASVTLTGSAPAAAAGATPAAGTVELDVDLLTGDVVLNSGGASISTVQITSDSKQLVPLDWKSIASFYGGSANGWSEEGKITSGLAEAKFSGFTPLAAGSTLDYGDIFRFNGIQDLVFTYTVDQGNGQGTLLTGNVVYTLPLPEPATLGLIGTAAAVLLGRRRRAAANGRLET